MGTRSGEAKDRGLTERQRAWLKHVQAAEGNGEALTAYAKRCGLSVGSLYEANRKLRQVGMIRTAKAENATKTRAARFVELTVRQGPTAATGSSLRIQLTNGTVLEWNEAPRGEALRDLFGIVS